jgi:signal transduction histidine kinase
VESTIVDRLPEAVEATAYYVVAEALANVNKHAGARNVIVRLNLERDGLLIGVIDDGVGGADEEGHGLRGLADRVEALGGTLTIDSPERSGTRVLARVPVV